jgi:hypothetical protein
MGNARKRGTGTCEAGKAARDASDDPSGRWRTRTCFAALVRGEKYGRGADQPRANNDVPLWDVEEPQPSERRQKKVAVTCRREAHSGTFWAGEAAAMEFGSSMGFVR